MVVPRPKAAASVECEVEETINLWKNASSNESLPISVVVDEAELNVGNITYEDRFLWSEYEQGLALGAYYWLHWVSQLPGGILARRYGTKIVFGWANLLTALVGFLIPFATRYHLYGLTFLRVIQGAIAGVVWPSMHDMTAKWIPPNERSRFVSAYLGSSVGAAITYPLCAAVCNAFGWEAAFHVTSALGVVWYCFWFFLVYDSPQIHPRITDDEKNYILDNITGYVEDTEETKIPWTSIFTSVPVWITVLAQWGSAWGFLTLMTQAPTYFNFIHGWNIHATGILSGAPHVLRMIFSYFYSIMSDWLLRTNRMSLTNVRKLATFVCNGIQGVFIIALGYSGCHPYLAALFMMAGIAVNGAISASTLASFVDLSPNYASVLLGFCGMVVVMTGFISPIIVGVLTNNNQTVGQWHIVFLIAGANAIAGCLIYMFGGTSKEQPWNQYDKPKEQKEKEMQSLQSKPEIIRCEEGMERIEKPEEEKLCVEQ